MAKKTLEKSIEEFHLDFQNFTALVGFGLWSDLSEEVKEEQKKNIKDKIDNYHELFKEDTNYSVIIPTMIEYLLPDLK